MTSEISMYAKSPFRCHIQFATMKSSCKRKQMLHKEFASCWSGMQMLSTLNVKHATFQYKGNSLPILKTLSQDLCYRKMQ